MIFKTKQHEYIASHRIANKDVNYEGPVIRGKLGVCLGGGGGGML